MRARKGYDMFKTSKRDVGLTDPIVYMTATTGETYVVGEALKIASGKVTKCTGTTTPEFVAVGPADGGQVPCIRVGKHQEFATTLGVAPGDGVTLAVGDKVTIHTDGLQLTATKTSGVAEILAIEGQTVGSGIQCRF